MVIIKKILSTTFKITILMAITIILTICGLYLYAFLSPKIAIKTNGKFFIYDDAENLVYQGSSSSEWIALEDINDNMKNAIINIEDKNFYKHHGFDYLRIAKALYNNFRRGYVIEGASTISQQYVKNMYLTFDKTWKRKIEEAMLTLELEAHYNKDEILEGYLNTINFGQGNYGIEDAAKYYFNKSSRDLSLEEACILAGIPKSPANLNPVSNYEASINRAKLVAKSMLNNDVITEEEYKSLYLEPLEIYGKRENNNLQTLMYYQDAVLDELKNIENLPKSLIEAGGIKIYTSLNMETQTILENSMKENMKDDSTQIASIYVEPNDGSVKALIGGKDYSKSQFNRATKAKRQVGSTIKPFLYYSAMENGLTMASTFTSEPTTFNLSNNKTYSPANYNNLYANQKISMAAALAYSDNVYAVKTHLFLGEDTLVDTMKKVGLRENLSAIPSLVLGTIEINMLDYATAYTTLANGGYEKDIHFIKRIEDMHGNTLYEHKDKEDLVLNYNYVYILNEMMTNAYNPDFIGYNSPTAISLKGRLSKKYAIKTGTTENDHWIVGFNPDALLIVWTGMDDNSEGNAGYSKITKNIWADAMENSLKDNEEKWYSQPTNVIGVPLDPLSGEFVTIGKNTMYYFVKGSEPQYYISVNKDEDENYLKNNN